MSPPPPRDATLVLVLPSGEVVGRLPPFRVETPWWQDAEPVVRGARERYGVDVTVLRVLQAQLPAPPGGAVTYLAEVAEPVGAAEPWAVDLDDHPLRQAWARPGGPAPDLAWADRVLWERGMQRVAPARQVRTWNLSSLWRVPVGDQTLWLKVVPPFFAHEGSVLERLAGGPFPSLVAHDGPRMLLAEIPGDDLYDAPLPLLLRMVDVLVDLQRDWLGRVDELLALGLPDWRAPALRDAIASVVERTATELSGTERAVLRAFVDGLDTRFAALADCGVRDTLVHGDFHPGNVRGDAHRIVLLDWGDSGIGHPLLDEAAFLDRIEPGDAVRVRTYWHDAWTRALPGSDPDRAAGLLAPVAAARQAVIYRRFLDAIEPSERPYHASDPAIWLARAAQAVVDAERAAPVTG